MNLGWPFARTRRESKAAAPLVALSQLGAAAWGGRDAAALTQDGYLRNAVAYRCVRMVAEAAASVPLVTQHDGAAKLLRQLAPDMAGELYAMPAATQALLEDSYADIDAWLADEVESAFAAQESAAFVSGDGTAKPRGFLDYEIVAEASHVWGKIGSVVGDFTLDDAADQIIDLIYTPKSQFRAGARFVMNRRTVSAVRKLKDVDGRYLWQPGSGGEPATIMGYAVTEMEDMPDIGASNAAIAFGDFRRGYLIADRQGARVLRDPYSAKPYVLFYTTKRVGGGVQNFDAIKAMVF
jgi:HK97 family phage major capsid protein